MPYLAFNLNNGNEFIFDLVEDRLSLGRNARNEILIENEGISSFHAELLRQADGHYEVVDLNSSNGTFVNDERVKRATLKPGDKVNFGHLEARFRDTKLPGGEREARGGTSSAEEKRRDAESLEGGHRSTQLIPIPAPAPVVAPAPALASGTAGSPPAGATAPPPAPNLVPPAGA
ncbi:FHA domain-containing protein, partial [Verrucomicrobium spinosum]